MGKLSATICVPFGAETVENDPCTVGTTRNYTAGTTAVTLIAVDCSYGYGFKWDLRRLNKI